MSAQDTLSKAGLHAIRLEREGDLQAAALIRAQMARIKELEAQADALLAHCPDPECHHCGATICPHKEPLHFHHDGCPACAQEETAQ